MNKKTVRDIDLKVKRVLMRVDFNVPMVNDLEEAWPTPSWLPKVTTCRTAWWEPVTARSA